MSNYFQLPGYKNSNWAQWDYNSSANILIAENDGRAGPFNLGAWQTFDRFYSVNTPAEEMSTKQYIFMLRPDLYIFEEEDESSEKTDVKLASASKINLDPYFIYLANQHPQILASLSLNFGGMGTHSTYSDTQGVKRVDQYMSENHKFIPYITSRVESLQLPDYSIKTESLIQPYSKYAVPYGTSASESMTGGSFDITFREDGNYSIHKLFYAWIYYQHNVAKNVFRPKDRYVTYNALDYATSVYSILVDATGENIIYWAKYTGVVPTMVPMSNFSFNRNGDPPDKISISFSYFLCEHLDQNSLLDFNYNSLGYPYMDNLQSRQKLSPPLVTVPIYNSQHFIGSNLVGRPIVVAETGANGKQQFKLRWLD